MSSEDPARWHDARAAEHDLLEATRRHRTQLRTAIAAAADRIDQILARAQDTAEEIRREAEREAERYLAARRRETERAIIAQQAAARAAFESLSRDLDRIAAQRASPPAAPVRESAPDREPAVTPIASRSPAAATAPAEAERRSDRAAALLLAGQLAVMGRGREEIEAALRAELGIERPAEIVDQILSPEGP